MTRDDIIRMAREAGFVGDVSDDGKPYQNAFGKSVPVEWLERFASKVAAAEREECANLIESLKEVRGKGWVSYPAWDIQKAMADIIRARGNKCHEAQDANG